MQENYIKFLEQKNFKTRLKSLVKKFTGKKVVVYGSGVLFSVIKDNYDLSPLDIIGIADKKFNNTEEVLSLDYDGVIVGVQEPAKIIEYLRNDVLKYKKDLMIDSFIPIKGLDLLSYNDYKRVLDKHKFQKKD